MLSNLVMIKHLLMVYGIGRDSMGDNNHRLFYDNQCLIVTNCDQQFVDLQRFMIPLGLVAGCDQGFRW